MVHSVKAAVIRDLKLLIPGVLFFFSAVFALMVADSGRNTGRYLGRRDLYDAIPEMLLFS